SPDAEALFQAKADPLLQSVRRASLADRSALKNGQSEQSLAAGGGAHSSAVESLSSLASVRRMQNGTVNVSLTLRLEGNSVAELIAAGFAVGARIGDVATVETDVDRLAELAGLAS